MFSMTISRSSTIILKMVFFNFNFQWNNDEDSASSLTSVQENSDDDSSQIFSFDLEERCVKYFDFLRTLHDAGVSKNTTSESLRRYLLWIKLLTKLHSESISTVPLIPPKDVAWLWYCHRLAPGRYQEFVEQICIETNTVHNSILEWCDPAGDPYAVEPNDISRQIWEFYNPHEPFDLDSNIDERKQTHFDSKNETLHGFDLLASARKQDEFYRRIKPFVESRTHNFALAVQNYHRFMALFREHPHLSSKLVPTYEVDQIWHIHMTGGSVYDYDSDCKWMCGKLIDHDDVDAHGDQRGVLREALARTTELWKSVYNDDSYGYSKGYRAPPAAEYYPVAEMKAGCKSNTTVQLESHRLPKYSQHEGLRCRPNPCTLVIFLIGMTLILLGVFSNHRKEYVCGSQPPTAQEIDTRGAPVCLTTSVRHGALCLQTGLDPNEPSIWCQDNVANIRGMKSFYLSWSSSDKCGTAWRMFWKPDDDVSDYKALQLEKPEPQEAPTSETWNKRLGTKWHETDLQVNECILDDLNDAGIPNACFVRKRIYFSWIVGISIGTVMGISSIACLCCESKTDGRRGNGFYQGGGGGGGKSIVLYSKQLISMSFTLFPVGGGGGGGGC